MGDLKVEQDVVTLVLELHFFISSTSRSRNPVVKRLIAVVGNQVIPQVGAFNKEAVVCVLLNLLVRPYVLLGTVTVDYFYGYTPKVRPRSLETLTSRVPQNVYRGYARPGRCRGGIGRRNSRSIISA